mmetsp:Transcript_147282/g.473116  ORF Transcript_147282/g.473116 Transcript_147282/m.473116 type:complete len:665 (-) Transcript_147282:117-2111(-)
MAILALLRRSLAALWRLRARVRLWSTKDRVTHCAGFSPLEWVHVVAFAFGILGSDNGQVPEIAIVLGYAFLLSIIFFVVDLRAFWRREQFFFVAAAREVVLATIAIYVDSVATYMVAVTNEHRRENIQLQDNVQHLLQVVFAQNRNLEALFLKLPEMVAAEAIFHAAALAVVVAAWGGQERVSVFAVLARAAKTMRCCRLLRVACYVSTVMPSQSMDCFVNRYDETYSLREHFREAVSHWRVGGGCNDLIYSCHGVVLSLVALIYVDHARDSGVRAALPQWFWWRVGHAALRIVYARMHMSVDLVVSLAVTSLTWHLSSLPSWEVSAAAPLPLHKPNGACTTDAERPPLAADFSVVPGVLSATGRAAVQRWIAITIATALAGFGLLVVNSNEAGPISEYNTERLHRIALAGESTGKRREMRLFCAMLHIETSAAARSGYARAVARTWGKRCNGLLMWDEHRADIAPLDLAVAHLEPGLETHSRDRWLRVRRMVRHIAGSVQQRFDWFIFVDDGGFVIPENFRLAAVSLEDESRRGVSSPLYVSGGWGFALNAPALAELILSFDDRHAGHEDGLCPHPSMRLTGGRQANAQALVQRCLAYRGLQASAWEQMSRVRSALGCVDQASELFLNLKYSRDSLCHYAVLAFMVPAPYWMYDIETAVYGES